MRRVFTLLLCGISALATAEPAKLTMEGALELARQNSPRLESARLKRAAAEKNVLAAGRRENPELGFEAEGIGGDLNGFESTEYALMLKQRFLRGEKRSLERRAANHAVDVAAQNGALLELDLLSRVRRAFIELLSQQETGAVRAEQEQLGRACVEIAERRHRAGGASELDLVQAELALQEIKLEQACCFGDLEAARIELASLLGMAESDLPELTGPYYELKQLEDSRLSDTHPGLRQIEAEIEVVRAAAARARADDAADITLGAGVKQESAGDVGTFVFGVSLPLNFIRSGRDAAAAMLTESAALIAERDELRRSYQVQLSRLAALYEGSRMEAELIEGKLLPKAREAYELTLSGYNAGRFSWLELIAAQQNLAEIRISQIDTLRNAHLIRAKLSKFDEKGMER